jgi:hypothetical protein
MYLDVNIYRQLSIIRGNGGEEGHRYPKLQFKTQAVKTQYRMDLMNVKRHTIFILYAIQQTSSKSIDIWYHQWLLPDNTPSCFAVTYLHPNMLLS